MRYQLHQSPRCPVESRHSWLASPPPSSIMETSRFFLRFFFISVTLIESSDSEAETAISIQSDVSFPYNRTSLLDRCNFLKIDEKWCSCHRSATGTAVHGDRADSVAGAQVRSSRLPRVAPRHSHVQRETSVPRSIDRSLSQDCEITSTGRATEVFLEGGACVVYRRMRSCNLKVYCAPGCCSSTLAMSSRRPIAW